MISGAFATDYHWAERVSLIPYCTYDLRDRDVLENLPNVTLSEVIESGKFAIRLVVNRVTTLRSATITSLYARVGLPVRTGYNVSMKTGMFTLLPMERAKLAEVDSSS